MSSLIIKELIKFVKKKFAADKAAKAGEGEKKAECKLTYRPASSFFFSPSPSPPKPRQPPHTPSQIISIYLSKKKLILTLFSFFPPLI